MRLPENHPLRVELNDEVHARPPVPLHAPMRLSYIALSSDPSLRERHRESAVDLARRYGAAGPAPGTAHYLADLGAFLFTWESHTEFVRYQFSLPGVGEDPFPAPALDSVPADWLVGLPGEILMSAHVTLLAASDPPRDLEALALRHFGESVVGATVGAGAGAALTDFRIRSDGFSRILVEDRGLTPLQAGRMVQRLLEIDTYRILALMALPAARELAPILNRQERELAEITTSLTAAGEADEAPMLDRLTRLAAEIESRVADKHFRFSAAAAYYGIVQRRIGELREGRIRGLQGFGEFTERRLAPAMGTCEAVARRQEALSQRVARATQLLSTRVDITRERQNQALLASMNRRANLQLRLQETVEWLSIAAVTYYVVGLVGYLAKGLKAAGGKFDVEEAMAVSIPLVALFVAFVLRRIRREAAQETE